MSELCRKGCGRMLKDAYGSHGNYRDRGDGICASCGRTLAWHAGTSCFCSLSTGMPAPLPITEQLAVKAKRSPDGTQVVIDGYGVGHGVLYPLDEQLGDDCRWTGSIRTPSGVANMRRSPQRESEDLAA